ncbi:hypothetical protein BpHYR1_001630 [Brachionus plicatilis]|uniref:Uncharacterized protein n=1 Tax=Brachionus plicatilis TaxID=10195 RepID=A0A3M7P5M3_BRAPC|nr:hypothetical protein BpHYR1_001630 [Brachionus plicatilis]
MIMKLILGFFYVQGRVLIKEIGKYKKEGLLSSFQFDHFNPLSSIKRDILNFKYENKLDMICQFVTHHDRVRIIAFLQKGNVSFLKEERNGDLFLKKAFPFHSFTIPTVPLHFIPFHSVPSVLFHPFRSNHSVRSIPYVPFHPKINEIDIMDILEWKEMD